MSRACGKSDCGREAVFEVSVPSYQQSACVEHLPWACWLMNQERVQVRLLTRTTDEFAGLPYEHQPRTAGT